jgi:hypothetical protein
MKRIKFRHGSCAVGLAVNFSFFSLSLTPACFRFFLRPQDEKKQKKSLFDCSPKCIGRGAVDYRSDNVFAFLSSAPKSTQNVLHRKSNHKNRRGKATMKFLLLPHAARFEAAAPFRKIT